MTSRSYREVYSLQNSVDSNFYSGNILTQEFEHLPFIYSEKIFLDPLLGLGYRFGKCKKEDVNGERFTENTIKWVTFELTIDSIDADIWEEIVWVFNWKYFKWSVLVLVVFQFVNWE